MIINSTPDKSGDPESLKNILFIQYAHSWGGFSEDVLQVLSFIVLWFKWSVKKHCVAKLLLAIWEILLHENNRNCNSYTFSYKVVFSYKLKTRIRFSASWWSGNQRYFYFLFIVSRVLLQSHAKFQQNFIKEFFYMLFLFVLYFHAISQEGKKETRQLTTFFIYFLSSKCLWCPFFEFENFQDSFSWGPSFGPFWSAKKLDFGGETCEIRILAYLIYIKIHIKESKKPGFSFLSSWEKNVSDIHV